MKIWQTKHMSEGFRSARWLDYAFGIIAQENPTGLVTLTSKYPGEFKFCDYVNGYLKAGLSANEAFKDSITFELDTQEEMLVLLALGERRLNLYVQKVMSNYLYKIVKP